MVAVVAAHVQPAVRFVGGAAGPVSTGVPTGASSGKGAQDGRGDPTIRPATSSTRIAARRIAVAHGRAWSAFMVFPLSGWSFRQWSQSVVCSGAPGRGPARQAQKKIDGPSISPGPSITTTGGATT